MIFNSVRKFANRQILEFLKSFVTLTFSLLTYISPFSEADFFAYDSIAVLVDSFNLE